MSAAFCFRFAAAAEGLVGSPFRLHGRDPASGLDCIGLVGEALRRCGRIAVLPRGYRLRMCDPVPLLHFAAANGFQPASGGDQAGDVVLVHLNGMQPHVLVALDRNAFVHAHAGLRRVVRQNGPYPAPAVGRWRLDEKG
jgi:cell wall-associated NlpC family hydrolase